MKRKREQIMDKARAKRQRKIAKQKPTPVEERPAPSLTRQIKDAATALSESVGNLMDSATEAVKTAVTKKRLRSKSSALPPGLPATGP